MMILIQRILFIVFRGLLISIPFSSIMVIGYFNDAPAFLGIIAWIEIIIVGFPWNIPVFILASEIERYFGPEIFFMLNENHDKTVGVFMFVGYVSVTMNCIVFSGYLYMRKAFYK